MNKDGLDEMVTDVLLMLAGLIAIITIVYVTVKLVQWVAKLREAKSRKRQSRMINQFKPEGVIRIVRSEQETEKQL